MDADKRKRRFIKNFWERVDVQGEDDCWLWKGAIGNRGGYGSLNYEGRSLQAHRVSYHLTCDDPGELYVLHKCDTPLCCNPKHLFLGTQLDNMRDMIRKGRKRQVKGEEHGRHKLTEWQVLELRREAAQEGVTKVSLANKYGISAPTVGDIVRHKLWKWLADE